MTMLRGAVIGVGKIAQTGHLPAYADARLRDRARIVAAVDPSAESRRIGGERYPEIRFYDGIDEMLRSETVDFVDICSTPETHASLIGTSVGNGLHVLCEKPLAPSVSESNSILSHVYSAGHALVIMPCHQYRYAPLWREFESFIKQLGAEEGCVAQFNVFRTEADPGLLGGENIWRLDHHRSGGGILADTGVHYLYLCLWMFGLPDTVTARTQRIAIGASGVEDTASVLLEYDRRMVQITLTWCADRRANNACIVSKRGSLVYDGTTLLKSCGASREIIAVPDASDKMQYVSLYVNLIEAFIEKIHSGQGCGAEILEAYESVRLLETCYNSAARGMTLELPEVADMPQGGRLQR